MLFKFWAQQKETWELISMHKKKVNFIDLTPDVVQSIENKRQIEKLSLRKYSRIKNAGTTSTVWPFIIHDSFTVFYRLQFMNIPVRKCWPTIWCNFKCHCVFVLFFMWTFRLDAFKIHTWMSSQTQATFQHFNFNWIEVTNARSVSCIQNANLFLFFEACLTASCFNRYTSIVLVIVAHLCEHHQIIIKFESW